MELKVYRNSSEIQRIFMKPEDTSFDYLKKNIIKKDKVEYEDDEKDWILLQNDQDWQECKRIWSTKLDKAPLKLRLIPFRNVEDSPSSTLTSTGITNTLPVDPSSISKKSSTISEKLMDLGNTIQDYVFYLYDYLREKTCPEVQEKLQELYTDLQKLQLKEKAYNAFEDFKKREDVQFCIAELKKGPVSAKAAIEKFIVDVNEAFINPPPPPSQMQMEDQQQQQQEQKNPQLDIKTQRQSEDELKKLDLPPSVIEEKVVSDVSSDPLNASEADKNQLKLTDFEKVNLGILREMGFTNDQKSIQLLKKHNNDLSQAVYEYLQ